MKAFFPKIVNKTRVPTLPTFIQHCIGSPGQSNEAGKRNKRHQIRKGEIKLTYYR